MSSDKNPGGRPSKYDPAMCERARLMAEAGAVDHDIAQALGISLSTLYRWRAEIPAFREAVQRGKAVADDAVEAALFRRATGYSNDAVKVFQSEGQPLIVPYVEHYAPDTTAAIFWLKNRRPERWRDKTEVEHSGAVDTGPDLSHLDDDELAVMRLLLEKKPDPQRDDEGEAPAG